MRVLVTGAGGQLGRELLDAFSADDVVGVGHADLDVADRERVLQVVGHVEPDIVVHAAAWTDVDGCELDPARAFAVNAMGSRNVAEASRIVGAHVVAIGTDYVFDGELDRPYHEWDATGPRSVYGASKLAGEREVLSLLPGAAVVRTSWVCGRHGRNIVKTVLRLAAERTELRFVDDQIGCPTFADDLAVAVRRIAVSRAAGTFHVTNQGVTSWYGFARSILEAAGHDPDRVRPVATHELDPPRPAPRPANSALDGAAHRLAGFDDLPHFGEPLARLVKELHA